MTERRFLFVTMPAGPFSRRLADALEARGAACRRVIFHGGEGWDWGAKPSARFRGRRGEYPAWIAEALARYGVTDVVAFNDVNPYSRAALEAARSGGLRTWVLENGYQRPDWITLETEGVNAASGLPRERAAYDDADRLPPPPERPHIGSITPYHVYNTVQHFTAMVASSPFMRGYRYPYSISIAGQVWGHTVRFGRFLLERRSRALAADRAAHAGAYFLLCLQREGDSQLVVHSDLKTNAAVLETVIASFAAHAPAEARLIVKNHPLDPGLSDLAGLTRRLGEASGLGDRLDFLEGGVFATLARGSRGVIAVNSTAALAAVGFGAPVKLLGRAFFDIPGLVDQQPLDGFWTNPSAPDPALFTRFRRRMSVETQVYGSFHNPGSLRLTAESVADRMLGGGRA